MSEFIKLATNRYSCRKYSDKPVSVEDLRLCLEAARLAPSARNVQPWRFVAVHSPSAVKEVASCVRDLGMNAFAESTPAFIVVFSKKDSVSRIGTIVDRDYSQIDVGIATAHLCLCAKDIGLDTCIMGWINRKKLKAVLKHKSDLKAELVIAIGHAAESKTREKRRKDMESIAEFI